MPAAARQRGNARLLKSGEEPSRDLVLFAADTPNSWKPAGLLEELGVEYDVRVVDIMANEQKQPEFLALNPNGRTPVLVDRSVDPPFAVFESNAILLYLADKFASPLLPRSATGRSEVEQWLMWQISALGPMLGQCMYMKRIATCGNDVPRLQFSIDRFHAESVRLLRILEQRLRDRDYLCGPARGDYTLADLACYGYAASHWWAGICTDDMPALQRWIERVGQRLAVQRGTRVPGISVLGPTGITFSQINTDPAVRAAIQTSADDAGRAYYNWKDMQALAGTDGSSIAMALLDARPADSGGKGGQRVGNLKQMLTENGRTHLMASAAIASAAFCAGLLLAKVLRS